jgi:hypothetical protein
MANPLLVGETDVLYSIFLVVGCAKIVNSMGFQDPEKDSCPIDVLSFLHYYNQQGYCLIAIGLMIL